VEFYHDCQEEVYPRHTGPKDPEEDTGRANAETACPSPGEKVQRAGDLTIGTVVVDPHHAIAEPETRIRGVSGRRGRTAPTVAGLELLHHVLFDAGGGQRLRRAGVPTFALGGRAGVVAIAPMAARDLGRRHGAAARPAIEQASQQGL